MAFKYKTVIFDIDETLVHLKQEGKHVLFGSVFAYFNIEPSVNNITRLIKSPDRDAIITDEFGIPLDVFWKKFSELDTVDIRKKYSVVYPDSSVVYDLNKDNIHLGIVSMSSKHIAEYNLSLIGNNLFKSVILSRKEYGIKQKPDSQGLDLCIFRLNSDKNSTLYVGDAEEDQLMAKNANVDFLWIDRNNEVKKSQDGFKIIKSLYEILN